MCYQDIKARYQGQGLNDVTVVVDHLSEHQISCNPPSGVYVCVIISGVNSSQY